MLLLRDFYNVAGKIRQSDVRFFCKQTLCTGSDLKSLEYPRSKMHCLACESEVVFSLAIISRV